MCAKVDIGMHIRIDYESVALPSNTLLSLASKLLDIVVELGEYLCSCRYN